MFTIRIRNKATTHIDLQGSQYRILSNHYNNGCIISNHFDETKYCKRVILTLALSTGNTNTSAVNG